MKNLILFFILIPTALKAQTVSGLYSGTLFNDTTKQLQQYQLALSEYRGKITGYSYTTFTANDTFYYGIRRIKAQIKDDQLIVEDDKMIVNNFPESPAKGVKRISVIPISNGVDTLRSLSGRWQTNRTKTYYAVPGSVDLKRDNDSSQSTLIGHLKELGIISTAVYQTEKETLLTEATPSIKTNSPKQKVTTDKPEETKNKPPKNETGSLTKKAETVAQEDVKTKPKETEKTVTKGAVILKPAPAAATILPYERRATRSLQTIEGGSDSLVLSFYDNGVVDGDAISVYVNGTAVITNARLTEAALKKTVRIDADKDSVEIILVAENLGTLPPNTGLLVVMDGTVKYTINFSADLQTNASIIFRKKK